MALPNIRQRSGYLLLAVVVGHVILISAQVTSRSGVPLLQAAVFGAIAEVQLGTGAVVDAVRNGWEGYVALRGVRRENQALQARVRDLEIALQRRQALADESGRLRQLLGLRDRLGLPTRAAEVIGASPTADFRTVTIDRGTDDGVRADMAVVAPAGAVGRVVTPLGHASKVQLLVDRNAAVAVVARRSRVQGIAVGTGENLLQLEYVAATADLKTGDELVTSGIDGIYPPGFVVGRVESVARTGGSLGAVRVRPAVDFSSLEQVLVVLAPPTPAGGGPAPSSAETRQ